jgi:hypothetical protein
VSGNYHTPLFARHTLIVRVCGCGCVLRWSDLGWAGGPCGVIAPVQACVLRNLIYPRPEHKAEVDALEAAPTASASGGGTEAEQHDPPPAVAAACPPSVGKHQLLCAACATLARSPAPVQPCTLWVRVSCPRVACAYVICNADERSSLRRIACHVKRQLIRLIFVSVDVGGIRAGRVELQPVHPCEPTNRRQVHRVRRPVNPPVSLNSALISQFCISPVVKP